MVVRKKCYLRRQTGWVLISLLIFTLSINWLLITSWQKLQHAKFFQSQELKFYQAFNNQEPLVWQAYIPGSLNFPYSNGIDLYQKLAPTTMRTCAKANLQVQGVVDFALQQKVLEQCKDAGDGLQFTFIAEGKQLVMAWVVGSKSSCEVDLKSNKSIYHNFVLTQPPVVLATEAGGKLFYSLLNGKLVEVKNSMPYIVPELHDLPLKRIEGYFGQLRVISYDKGAMLWHIATKQLRRIPQVTDECVTIGFYHGLMPQIKI